MATNVRRRARPATRTAPAARALDIHRKLEWEYVDITDIVPYPFNPRDNAKAIADVAESIKLVGFVVPIVLDVNNVIVAGHTRVEAAKLLGMLEVPALRATHLTEDQITAFRLIDNKVSESASWDFDLLAGEFSKLQGIGLDFTRFGWSQEEIDCLSEVVSSDCLEAAQVAQAAASEAGSTAERRAPTRARFVLGEVVFFAESPVYRSWIDGLRQLHEFNEVAIVNDIKRRLGILE